MGAAPVTVNQATVMERKGDVKAIKRLLAALMAVVMLAAGCAPAAEEEGDDRPVVYASFYPVHDLVHRIAGDTIDLHTFMPADKDPHLWEPTPKDMAALSEADLLVVNGANFEPWLDQVRDALPNLKVLRLSDYVELITYKGAAAIGEFQYLAQPGFEGGKRYSLVFGHTHERFMRVGFFRNDEGLEGDDLIDKAKQVMEAEGDATEQTERPTVSDGQVLKIKMGHESGRLEFEIPDDGNWMFVSDRVSEQLLPYHLEDSGGNRMEPEPIVDGSSAAIDKVTFDPHSWLSLVNAKRYANAINDTLRKMYPEHEEEYNRAKFELVSEITDLHNEYRMKMKKISRREFVVSHNAYEYLSRDFDLKQYPLQGLTSLNEPSVRTLIDAIRFVRTTGINTIYYEYGAMPYGADTIAAEVDGQTLPLASMEFISPEQADEHQGYVDFMRMNLENIYSSLK